MNLAPKPAIAYKRDRIAPDRQRRNASRMALTLAVLIGVALILLIGREALGFHARALRLSQDELAAEARRIEVAVAVGQRELQFLRLGSQQILKLPVGEDFAGGPGLQRVYDEISPAVIQRFPLRLAAPRPPSPDLSAFAWDRIGADVSRFLADLLR